MSRAIIWSRENFVSNDIRCNAYVQKELSLSAHLKETLKKVSSNGNQPTEAEVLRTPDEGMDATEDTETMVYDMATTAEDLELLGFFVMESSKEREIANYYHTHQNEGLHSTATDVSADDKISENFNKEIRRNHESPSVKEIAEKRRAEKRKRETDSKDCVIKQGDSATSTNIILSTDDCLPKIGKLTTTPETQRSSTKVIKTTEDLATSTSLSNTEGYITGDTATSIETALSHNAEDFFSNPEDFLSNTEDLFSNPEDFLSGVDDLATSPEDFLPNVERCQLELVEEQCKVFDKLMEENRLLTQELINLSTLPRTPDTVSKISKGLKMITELSQRMRHCTTASLLHLTPL